MDQPIKDISKKRGDELSSENYGHGSHIHTHSLRVDC